jgi:ribosomal protein L5
LAHALTKRYLIPQISYDQSSAICGLNIAWSGAFGTQAVVAAIVPF